MEIVQNIALISINATLVVQLVSFLLFVALLNWVMVRPLRKVMSERDAYTQRVGREVVSASEAYADISRQIKTQEADARMMAHEMRSELEAAGKASAKVVLEQTRQEIHTLKEGARKDADAKIALARERIQSEAEPLADQMIASLLGKRSPS